VDRDEEIRELMAKLMEAVETSLATSTRVREALDELARHGLEPRLYFVANTDRDAEEGSAGASEGEVGEELGGPADEEREARGATHGDTPGFELTRLDLDFLKSVHIRPEAD
jgi:hypothetical protein